MERIAGWALQTGPSDRQVTKSLNRQTAIVARLHAVDRATTAMSGYAGPLPCGRGSVRACRLAAPDRDISQIATSQIAHRVCFAGRDSRGARDEKGLSSQRRRVKSALRDCFQGGGQIAGWALPTGPADRQITKSRNHQISLLATRHSRLATPPLDTSGALPLKGAFSRGGNTASQPRKRLCERQLPFSVSHTPPLRALVSR